MEMIRDQQRDLVKPGANEMPVNGSPDHLVRAVVPTRSMRQSWSSRV
jgi:hypothetical protein